MHSIKPIKCSIIIRPKHGASGVLTPENLSKC